MTVTLPNVNLEILMKTATSITQDNIQVFLHGTPCRRGELSYLAPLGSENISAPYFKQCFFRGGGYYPPRLGQTPRLPVPRQE